MALCNFFDDFVRPSRLLDQHFGTDLLDDDVFTAVPRLMRSPYFRPWRSLTGANDCGSTITADKENYRIDLDVKQFAPEEIAVTVSGKDTITIEGKHEEKKDDHGYVSRHFVRRYVLPRGHDVERVTSQLSSDGVLSITAPKSADERGDVERHVPIVQTGSAAAAIDEKRN